MAAGIDVGMVLLSSTAVALLGNVNFWVALAVMAVAASEVVVGLGLIVALHRSNVELDIDKLTTLRG